MSETKNLSPLEEAQVRLLKMETVKKAGREAFPSECARSHMISAVLDDFQHLSAEEKVVTVAGRIKAIRTHGGLTFMSLVDDSGEMQMVLKKDELGEKEYEFLLNTLDAGDFIEVTGVAFITKRGEKSIDAETYKLLTKALLPLPEKWHGLTDTETRYRKRYLDLIANPEVKKIFSLRSKVVRHIRNFLDNKGFMEVETPILQTLAGGASARPFVTHHNALDIDLYLRIAPELFLKRLIVGGFEKVYEVARCFRNEGVSFQHNPEFTQVEFYWAYANYEDLMRLTEELICGIVAEVTGGKNVVERDGVSLSFKAPFARRPFFDLIMEKTGIDLEKANTEALLKTAIETKKLKLESKDIVGFGELCDALYKQYVRPNLIQPTFVIDYPVEMIPLAKRKDSEPNKIATMQLLVQGMELCKAYNELNDPIDQEARFKEEEMKRGKGSEEAMETDADFVEALKHGLPPTAGFGMGIDRLCSVLFGTHSIKEVILFPTMKPEVGGIKNMESGIMNSPKP